MTPGPAPGPASGSTPGDPVLARRRRLERWASAGQRVGYLAIAVSVAAFVVGFIVELTPLVVIVVVAGIVVATLTLAPAIVVGYAVKAAERDDREAGAGKGPGDRERMP